MTGQTPLQPSSPGRCGSTFIVPVVAQPAAVLFAQAAFVMLGLLVYAIETMLRRRRDGRDA
jgi:hypothetical protein